MKKPSFKIRPTQCYITPLQIPYFFLTEHHHFVIYGAWHVLTLPSALVHEQSVSIRDRARVGAFTHGHLEAYTFKYPYTYLSYKKENNYFVIIPLIWWFFRAKHCKNGVLQLLPIRIWLWVASLAQIKPRKFVTFININWSQLFNWVKSWRWGLFQVYWVLG